MDSNALVRPLPGAGIAARTGDFLLVCAETAEADELLRLMAEVVAAGGDGSMLIRRTAALIAADLDGRFPDCAISGPAHDGRLAVLVFGAATADVAGADGHMSLSAADAIIPVTRVVAGPVTAVRLQLPGAGSANPRSRLDSGVVVAAGVDLAVGGAAVRSPAEEDHGAFADAVAQPHAAAEQAVAAEDGEPLPSTMDPEAVAGATPAATEPVAEAEAPRMPGPVLESVAWDPAAEPDVEPSAENAAEPAAWEPAPVPPPVRVPPPEYPHQAPPEPVPTQPAFAESTPADAAPAESAPAAPAAGEPAPFVSVLLAPDAEAPVDEPPAAAPPAAARPLVQGVLCPNDHFIDPRAAYCPACGAAMAHQTLVVREGPRPPLGVLVLDDGSVFHLDTDYVVGREPQHDPDVIGGSARPLRIVDAEGVVSRRHARIAVVGWDLQVIDLGSANGTFIDLPGDPQRHQLRANEPVTVGPGTQVTLGRRWFRFEPLASP